MDTDDSEFSVFLKDGGKLGEQMRGTDGRERVYFKFCSNFFDDGLDINPSLRSGWCWDFLSSPLLNCFINSGTSR